MIGELFYATGNWTEAREVWFDCLKYVDRRNPANLSKVLNNLAVAFAVVGDWKPGLKYARESLRLKKRMGDEEGLASAYQTYGNYLVNNGKLPEAISAYLSALELKLRSRQPDEVKALMVARSIHGIGRVFKELGEYELAASIYETAEKRRRQGVEVDSIQTLHSQAVALLFAARERLRRAIVVADQYGESHEKYAIKRLLNSLENTEIS